MTPRTWLLTAILVVLGVVWIAFHRQFDGALSASLLLRSERPSEESFNEIANQGADPTRFLERCWATGKVVHRQFVADFLKDKATPNRPWFGAVGNLVLAGAMDPDISVRQQALATLGARSDPRLFNCAQAQLTDPDPLVRLLGLDYVRKTDSRRGIPVAMRMLDDPDLLVVAKAETALMRWTGEDFGIRARLAIPPQDGPNPGQIAKDNLGLFEQGIARRKAWWQLHAAEFPNALPVQTVHQKAGPPVADFKLNDLDGRPVRLADFRGKMVLLNFWATWCPACLTEIPDLVTLQKTHAGQIAVIGVALDGVPDDHGHQPGSTEHDTQPKVLREQVGRAAKDRGINYAVLMDPDNSVGARFNGGELPTTVIIDSQGRLRRRFVGARNLRVFEAMILEAAEPASSGSHHGTVGPEL